MAITYSFSSLYWTSFPFQPYRNNHKCFRYESISFLMFLSAVKSYDSVVRENRQWKTDSLALVLERHHGKCFCSQLTQWKCWSSQSSSNAYLCGICHLWSSSLVVLDSSLWLSTYFQSSVLVQPGKSQSIHSGPMGDRVCPSTEHSWPLLCATMTCFVTLTQLYVCGRGHGPHFLARTMPRLISLSLLQHIINMPQFYLMYTEPDISIPLYSGGLT